MSDEPTGDDRRGKGRRKGPLKRSQKPIARRRGMGAGGRRAKRQTPLTKSARPRAKSFSEKYPDDHDGPRYGPEFRAVRVMPCALCVLGYEGPGHKIGDCALGETGGPTAHHLGREDRHGLVPCGGAAHDLLHRIGRRATEHFDAWLEERGYTLEEIGRGYYDQARAASTSP